MKPIPAIPPFMQNGPIVPGKGGNLFPPVQKPHKPAPTLSKKRTRR
jgi:hypothetical protein